MIATCLGIYDCFIIIIIIVIIIIIIIIMWLEKWRRLVLLVP